MSTVVYAIVGTFLYLVGRLDLKQSSEVQRYSLKKDLNAGGNYGNYSKVFGRFRRGKGSR